MSALAATLVVTLAACGGSRDRSEPTGTTVASAEQAVALNEPDPVAMPERATPGQVVMLDSTQAAALIDAVPETLVIDVRSQPEYIGGHLVGAQNIEVEDPGLWERRTSALDRDRPTIVYCRSGNRSAHAAQLLVDAGFTEVYDLGGIGTWTEGDLPVDR